MTATGSAPRVGLLRFVNDAIYELARLTERTMPQRFVCECDDVRCAFVVPLTAAEYAACRAGAVIAH